MRRAIGVFALGFVAGCGWSEVHFVDRYVEAECELELACLDDATLLFLGWSDVDDCTAVRGPELATDTEGCPYESKNARRCVKELSELTCAPDGGVPTLPASCSTVWINCGETPYVEDSGGVDTEDSSADTGA